MDFWSWKWLRIFIRATSLVIKAFIYRLQEFHRAVIFWGAYPSLNYWSYRTQSVMAQNQISQTSLRSLQTSRQIGRTSSICTPSTTTKGHFCLCSKSTVLCTYCELHVHINSKWPMGGLWINFWGVLCILDDALSRFVLRSNHRTLVVVLLLVANFQDILFVMFTSGNLGKWSIWFKYSFFAKIA